MHSGLSSIFGNLCTFGLIGIQPVILIVIIYSFNYCQDLTGERAHLHDTGAMSKAKTRLTN